jgi:hypothetical protein
LCGHNRKEKIKYHSSSWKRRIGTGNFKTGGAEMRPCIKKIMEMPTYGKIIICWN